MSETKKTGLELLREPFPAHQISKLPKGTKAQNDCPASEKVNCKVCGGWHHPRIIHLDYVGHAALTDRLLDCDPEWNWEPLAVGNDGYPVVDKDGGMWIKLTVCGITRLGYGDAQGKTGGNATKERIGDALRNAAMRFGAALDLWHKGELHLEEDEPKNESHVPSFGDKPKAVQKVPVIPQDLSNTAIDQFIDDISKAGSMDELKQVFSAAKRTAQDVKNEQALEAFVVAKDVRKLELEQQKEAA